MLTIIKGSSDASAYFSKDNYYTKEEGLEHSCWRGQGAALLSLSGRVNPDQFKHLLEGEVADQKLGRVVKGKRQHRSGWDLTFSAPKSLSILSEIYGVSEVREAHENAVSHAIKAAERLIQTRLTKDGVTQIISTNNGVFASFTHDVNRNLDCQLHTHNYLLNMTHTVNGWRSLYTEALFASQREKELGKVYRMALAKELVARNYQLRILPGEGLFEIEGVPQGLIDEFSTRSKEIDQWFESRKIPYDPALAKTVSLITRSAKKSVPRDELVEIWKERAAAYQFDLQEFQRTHQVKKGKGRPRTGAEAGAGVRGEDRERNQRVPIQTRRTPGAVPENVKKAVKHALNHLAERDMGFTKKELAQEADIFALGSFHFEDVQQEIERLTKTGAIVRSKDHPDLPGSHRAELEYWTTPSMKALEASLIQAVGDSKNAFETGLVKEEYASKQLEKTILNEQQREAIIAALSSKDRFTAIQGDPGVGKTTALREYKKILAKKGYEVLAMAPNYKAVSELEDSLGIQGMTVDRYLADPNSKKLGRPFKRQVWIVDETSMLATDRVIDLMEIAEQRKARVIFVGDHEQLEAVGSGRGFKHLLDAGVETSHLNKWVRPKTDLTKTVFQKVMAKEYGDVIRYLDSQERVSEIARESTAISSLAEEWLSLDDREKENTQIIAPTNEQVEKINRIVRDRLKMQGKIESKEKRYNVFSDKHMTGEQTRFAGAYSRGDVIRFSQEHLAVGKKKNDAILRYEYFDVIGVNPTTNTLALQSKTDKRKKLYIDPARVGGNIAGGIQVFNTDQLALAKGDKVRWLDNKNQLGLKRNTELSVGRISDKWVRFDKKDGTQLKIPLDDLKNLHFGHDYAKTAYGVQGATKDRVIAIMNSWRRNTTHARSFMVALTRAKSDIKLYVDSKSKVSKALHERTGSNTEALTKPEFDRSMKIAKPIRQVEDEARPRPRTRLI